VLLNFLIVLGKDFKAGVEVILRCVRSAVLSHELDECHSGFLVLLELFGREELSDWPLLSLLLREAIAGVSDHIVESESFSKLCRVFISS
jgi:hypothetical protein